MSDVDLLVSAALDAQVPLRLDRRPDWGDVLARADVARVTGPQQTTTTWLPRRRRRVILAFALLMVGGVVAAAAIGYHPLGGLLPPAGDGHGSLDAGHRRGSLDAGHRHGSLDTSFGRGGKVMTPPVAHGAAALAIQKDGKLVAAGGFALARYNANGSLDTSFGRGGKTPPGGSGGAHTLAIQKDGKLVAAGWGGTEGHFALARYNADGSLDTSFGRGGKVTTPIGSGQAEALALAIQKDGKLVAAGYGGGAGGTRGFALVRYNANGSLDGSFGRGGKVTTLVGSYGGGAGALAIQKDGKLVAAGESHTRSHNDFALVRYHANGSLDTSFGRGGKVTTPTGSYAGGATALAIKKDGKLVAAGDSDNGHGGGFALVQYNANGSLDTSFGRGGKVLSTPGAYGAGALAIQKDGKLVVSGSAGYGGFALVRYNANGSLDTSFGRGGKVTTPIGSGEAGAGALVIQRDGKLVAAGGRNNGNKNDSDDAFVLVRYWP